MKQIATPPAFCSFASLFKKSVLFKVFVLFTVISVSTKNYAQQVIGSFPSMDGGFEGQTITGLTLPLGAANYTANTAYTTYNRNNNASAPVCAFYRATGGNSSPKCISWTNASTSAELFGPTAAADAILSNTSYVVQFYAKQDSSDRSRQFNVRVYTNGGASATATATAQSGTLSYQKFTAIVTSSTVSGTGKRGYFSIRPSGGSFYNSFTPCNYLFDDFCVYAGNAVDNSAPDEVVSPSITGYTSTSLNLSWSAPATGVDGGGYVVIRYASNPASEPAPITNGIYAVGNTVGNGTIVYIGTATTFNNTGLTANTAYYYRIYVADKAFNYSPTPLTVAGFTGTAGPTAVSFTTPATCLTDRITISWTGPLNYNSANNTLLGFIKAGSAVTIGTPTNALATYTASTNFAAPGTAYQNDLNAYCIINGDGTNSAGDHSGLTITGLTPGTTYHVLLFNVVNATTSYSAGSTGSGTTLTAAAEPANNPTGFAKGALTTSNIPLTWVAAAGSPSPTGYLIKASNTPTPADPTDSNDPADQLSIVSGTANVKTAATSLSSFTGFSAGTMYYFRINSYTNTGSCIDYKPTGPTINAATLPNAVTSQTLSITGGTGTINWTTAIGYSNSNHTTLVFVSSSAIAAGTPTINPATYTANSIFGAGTAFQLDANAKCVYNGDASSATVTGLISGNTYYVLVLTVMSTSNSDGTYSYSAYANTSTTYNSANEYTWNGSVSTDFQDQNNWTPVRFPVTTSDVLIYNSAGAVTSTNVPTQQIAKLAINAGNVTLLSSGATLTVTNTDIAPNINDLIVAVGSSLTLGSTVSLTLGNSSLAYIAGSLNVNSGNTYNTNGTSVVTIVAGTLNNYGTVTSTTATKFVVNNEGIYNHGINGLTIPTGTWNFNSSCLITGVTSSQNFSGNSHGQTFSKFIWDCPGQSATHFVLGAGLGSAPFMVITDSFIVRSTGPSGSSKILQITSSGGQNNFTCGNYFQYGGIVAVTYNTDAGGLERSLTVNNTFYVTDSLVADTKFQIINNPGGTNNINGRLYVKGNFEMHPGLATSSLEATKGVSNPSVAELWFSGSVAQYARFSTVAGNVDFVTNHTGSGVNLLNDVTANKFKLMRGTFFIGSNTLTIKDSVTYPLPGSGTIGGSLTSNLTLNGIAGTLAFYTGYRTLKNLTQTAGSTASLGTELAIAPLGRDSLGIGAVLTTNDNLILRSDATGTARIAQIPTSSGVAQATITDKVTVERYLPMNLSYDSRRWRLLTAPFKASTAPTIQAAWQEGTFCPDRTTPAAYDPKPGYGTHITRSTTAANGFDQGSTNNPSIYYYSGGAWMTPLSTTGVKVTDNNGVYHLFVRGDRSIIIQNQFVAAKPTTLDPKGELYLGDVTIPMNASGFQPVGNPYASQIKLDNIVFNDTLGNRKTIYLWDPKALGSSGVGAFITCSGDGGSPATYTYSGNASNYGSTPGVIESSGVFMVKANGGNIVFHETDKTITSSTIGVASRPSRGSHVYSSLGKISKLYIDLIGSRNGAPSLADGIAVTYNKNYSNDIDDMDAVKLLSFSTKERISIQKANALYSIERRNAISENDTIQLYVSRLNVLTYKLDFRPVDFDNEFTAYIEDRFTGISTPVILTENSSFGFDITDDSLSSASNRFFITFKRNRPATNNEPAGITIFPNPVINNKISIAMNKIPAGEYSVRLINNLGQVIHRSKLIHQDENVIETINISNAIANGVYKLEIISAEKRIAITNVMIQ